ncbi:WG repeat-containing protein [Bernardetia sp. MNP-M8]|uniref:WG repeat-containing protein n=1 Tax=Bernardetia sp. MNP-M8 TaxID=3127470 RepID=UPI0030CA5D6A
MPVISKVLFTIYAFLCLIAIQLIYNYLNIQEQKKVSVNEKAIMDSLQKAQNIDALYKFEKNGKYGLINQNNKVKLEPIYDEINDFKEGIAWLRIDKKYGYVDRVGNIVIPYNNTTKV